MGDAILRVASPVGVLEHARGSEELIRGLRSAVDEHLSPGDTVVFGLPIHMDGTEGERAKIVRAFAADADLGGRAVAFHDERLTSVDADWKMAQSGLTHKQKKARRDAMAAASILQDFLSGL